MSFTWEQAQQTKSLLLNVVNLLQLSLENVLHEIFTIDTLKPEQTSPLMAENMSMA